ncbi:unnamed protein product [Paramecium primaurelia]|uniref:Uncharacterized protein n=1 Tax=Paramecium primaurelia TaxID=5886 RepID=A0A8S1MEL5_PARPR|nr:unnamed protein product [Paramecium primaurelia]
MNICQDSKITCQLTDIKTESNFNDFEQIIFNNDSTIQLKDKYYSQLQYLTFSNPLIAIPKSQILIQSLNNQNARIFILNIDYSLGLCYKLLLNKNENILFLNKFNEVRIFLKINNWIKVYCYITITKQQGYNSIIMFKF